MNCEVILVPIFISEVTTLFYSSEKQVTDRIVLKKDDDVCNVDTEVHSSNCNRRKEINDSRRGACNLLLLYNVLGGNSTQ